MAVPEVPHQRQNFLGGFKLTLEHLGRPPVTRQYPEEKRPKQPRQHGRHVLNRYEDGMEKCIGCELCAGVCPADCIYVRGLDNPPDHPVSPGERYGYVYEINFLRCIHCDLCVEACPTEAITESKLMEFSFTNRNDAIYTKDELLVDDDGKPQRLPWEDWREGDDLYTSGWMRATSPSGSAETEGRVQWSGELGYGVRSPESGQAAVPDDATTGSRQLRDTLERHLRPGDLPAAKRGPRGAIGRMLEKAERFAPGAGKKHRQKADSDYEQAVADGNVERDLPGADPVPPVPSAGPEPDHGTGSSAP
jgi:NADH-quinone oxidoreductase subunit I